MDVEESLSKRLYKALLLFLKIIPSIIGAVYVIYTLLAFCGVDAIILGYLCHMSILPWIFIYITSITFKFCIVHRLPLYYIVVNDTITIVDTYCGIPISDFKLLMVHSIILGIFIILTTILHIKIAKYVKNNKRTTR